MTGWLLVVCDKMTKTINAIFGKISLILLKSRKNMG